MLPPASVAMVKVDGLRLREEPSTSARVIATLAQGELVNVTGPEVGPKVADGSSWYQVAQLNLTELPAFPTEPLTYPGAVGWVAFADGNQRFLELVPARCVEEEPELGLLESLTAWERLACYGDRVITLEGAFGCGGCGGVALGLFEPRWLANPLALNFLSTEPQERIGPLALHFAPGDPEPPEWGSIIRVVGHVDDVASIGCTVAPGDPPSPTDPMAAELYCRERFVVDSYEVIGFDEDFPTG